ncbi:MAG: phosphate regulon transcriptional regulator PhoB [Rhodospirillales bacterium]|nr:phosphate regulon transcriptional regulator PhoB [Rhodospirillales bacterium]
MDSLILIVEDEAPQAEMLRYNLEKEGFRTSLASNGEEAIARVDMEIPDLAVVDWMLPERSGIDVCRWLRVQPETRNLPIIMLTARGTEGDRVLGLQAGTDDYVVKPYSPKEMIARIQALLRRSAVRMAGEEMAYAGVVMDMDAHKVMRDGKVVHLGPTSFAILKTLMERPNRVFSRDSLLRRVWGDSLHVEPRTVDVHIRRLRKSKNAHGGANIIRTVRSAGYAIDADS